MTFHPAVLSAIRASLYDTTTCAASFIVRQIPVTAKISTSASTVVCRTHSGIAVLLAERKFDITL